MDAAAEIYRALRAKKTRGVIVGAGTGSGKTLAFYLPAFAAISGPTPGRHRVHTLALYPRNELLRDQLREAVSAARSVADVLRKSGRGIRVGALYGATPGTTRTCQVSGTDSESRTGRRARRGRDVVCPYLPCPECGGDLLWSEADRLANRDRLTCSPAASSWTTVALTRKTLQNRPPDMLFTTTEMLNQHASSDLGRLLGWRTGQGAASAPATRPAR